MKTAISPKALLCAFSLLLAGGADCAETAEQLIRQGDVYDLKFNPAQALMFYLPAEKLAPTNEALLLRIARQYRHEMADTPGKADKLRYSSMALSYAERAVALAPKDSEAHLSIAINYAKSIDLYGSEGKMKALRQVKCSADQAIALDGNNHLAWYILGRWHQRVGELGHFKRVVAEMAYGELPKATLDEAVRCFGKAVRLDPNRSVYLVDLGITYGMMGNKELARKLIEKGLALPSTGKDDPATKQRGQEMLKSLK